MEIDFMILWKKKVAEKKDLHGKVMELLETVFPNTELDKLLYIDENDVNHSLPYSISSTSDDIVYLKIECNYSDAKSAKILSIVRDKLCNSKDRADFSIICTYDDASLSFCCRLMKPFGVFERRLREIMYLTTVKTFGSDWVTRTFPAELIAKIKDVTGGMSDEKLTEKALEFLDYSNITSYLFDERRWVTSLEQIFDEELSDEKLETMTKEKMIQVIYTTRRKSLWDILFSDDEKLKPIAQKVEMFRSYRNDTMHHHTMKADTFKKVQSQLKKANLQLKQAISVMERKMYTNGDKIAVLSAFSICIPKMLEGISKAFSPIIENIGKVASVVVENLSLSIKELAAGLADTVKSSIEMSTLNSLSDSLSEIKNMVKPTNELTKTLSAIGSLCDIPKSDDIIESTNTDEENNT